MAFASDSFTGGIDGQALNVYSVNWTKIGAGTDILINTERAYCGTANAGWSMFYWNAAQATSANYDVSCTVTSGVNLDTIGPAGRMSSDGTAA